MTYLKVCQLTIKNFPSRSAYKKGRMSIKENWGKIGCFIWYGASMVS